MSKANEAVECYNKSFNCAQAVFSTYSEKLGLDKTTALKTACGLGGGLGRLGETCGAVTGAILLIGLKYGKTEQSDNAAKEKTYELTREFVRRFKTRNTYASCRELLDIDLMTGDKDEIKERCKRICPEMVRSAAEIIEEMLWAGRSNLELLAHAAGEE